jgi:hypothetical protein
MSIAETMVGSISGVTEVEAEGCVREHLEQVAQLRERPAGCFSIVHVLEAETLAESLPE